MKLTVNGAGVEVDDRFAKSPVRRVRLPAVARRRDLAVSCREHIEHIEHIEASPELTGSERTAVLGATATTLIRLATLRPQTQTRAS